MAAIIKTEYGRAARLVVAGMLLVAFYGFSSLPRAPEPHATISELTPSNDSIFAARIATAHSEHLDLLPIGARIAAVGTLFLGTPYVANTLDTGVGPERLIVNLRGLDCVTFYENTLALARVIREYAHPTMQDYERELTFLRYRNGIISGYHSRLNYTIDYFYNNEQKGVFNIVTRAVGGRNAIRDNRAITFMTTHRSLYKQLRSNSAEYNAMLGVERDIHARDGFYYIPKSDIPSIEHKIETGDIIGVTTNIPGLDCSHTGIAVRERDGRVHFMEASSLMGKVILTSEPLAEYLTHSSRQTGIIIARPLEARHKD